MGKKERIIFVNSKLSENRFVLLIRALHLLLFFQHSVTSFKPQKVTENKKIRFGCGFDDDILS